MSEPTREPASDPERRGKLDDNPVNPSFARAYQSAAAWARFLLPALLGLTADLWLKRWSFPEGVPAAPRAIAGRHPMSAQPVLDHILAFQTTVNHGGVFGYGQGMVSYFLLFSILAMGIILWVFLTSRRSHWVVHIALGLITAGALGNLFDRAMFGGVRDMLKLTCMVWGGVDHYPFIFNIADVLLCVGVPLLMMRWLFMKEPPRAAQNS